MTEISADDARQVLDVLRQARYGYDHPLKQRIIEGLDEGIRRAVIVLHNHGIETYESCEGGDGHSYAEPTVRFAGGGYEIFRAFAVASMYALPVKAIRRTWTVSRRDAMEPDGPTNEIVFRQKLEDDGGWRIVNAGEHGACLPDDEGLSE